MNFAEHILQINKHVDKKKEEGKMDSIFGNESMSVDGKGFAQVSSYRLGNTTHYNVTGNGQTSHFGVTQNAFGLLITD